MTTLWLISIGLLGFVAGCSVTARLFGWWFKKFMNGELPKDTYDRVLAKFDDLPSDKEV